MLIQRGRLLFVGLLEEFDVYAENQINSDKTQHKCLPVKAADCRITFLFPQ